MSGVFRGASGVVRCLQVSSGGFRCFQVFSKVFRCPSGVLKALSKLVFFGEFKWFQVLSGAFRCLQVSSGVLQVRWMLVFYREFDFRCPYTV